MKKVFFLSVLLWYCLHGFAQLQLEDTLNTTHERWRDTCFGLIDRGTSQIPSGYLLDYSLVAFASEKYDGIPADDTIKAYGDFFALYNIIEMSAVNGNATLPPTNDLFINASRYKRDTRNIPFVLLHQQYQRINSGALSNNLFSITGDSLRLIDVSGRPASPYDTKEILICTPFQTRITSYNAVRFTFPNDFWLIPGVTSISVDFGDGAGFRTVAKGSTVDINYTANGKKYITCNVNTVNGTRTAKTMIEYARGEYYYQADSAYSITVPPVYTDANDYLGISFFQIQSLCTEGNVFDQVDCDQQPGAEIRILNGCDRVFDRPIIVVEGFDADNTVGLNEIVATYERYRFIEDLRILGYDLVFVNLTKPRDFIENNAKVLEGVITRVNLVKSGNNRGSVIGFSMGGLIARWCLKDMEDRSIDHKMDHYFSYDAPHQGANIPLGLQYLFGEIERDLPFLKWNNLKGNAIFPTFQAIAEANAGYSSQQMLVTKASYNDGPFNWDPNLSTLNPLRAAFAQRLASKGYPQNLTCHGIAMGRGNNTASTKNAGNGQQFGNFGPGSKLFEGNLTYWLINLTSSAYAVPENGNTDYICRYRFAGLKIVKLFGIIPYPSFRVRVRNFKYTSPNSYDDAPGSYEVTQTQFRNSFNEANIVNAPATNNGHHGHNFVSTVSALDLTNQNYNATTSWQSNNLFFNIDNFIQNAGTVSGNTLSNASLSPFDFVLTYTSDCGAVFCESLNDDVNDDGSPDFRFNNWNQLHNGFISRQCASYMQRKILNSLPPAICPSLCNTTNTFTGSDFVCADEYYELVGVSLSGLKFNWQVSNGNLIITEGQGTPRIRVAKVSDGFTNITVTISNICGQSRFIQRSVTVGKPKPVITQIIVDPGAAWLEVFIDPVPGASTYYWYLNGDFISEDPVTERKMPKQRDECNVGYQVEVEAVNTCGISAKAEGFGYAECEFLYTLSPNPASGILYVTASTEYAAKAKNARQTAKAGRPITEIRIYDQNSRLRQQAKFSGKGNQVTVNTGNLRAGIYFVEIYSGEYKETRKLSIIK